MAEDNYLLRESVTRLLEAQPGIEIVAVCDDLDSLLAAVDTKPTDVVLTDIRMPPTGTDEGIRAATYLRTHHPEVGVVVLSQYAEAQYALELLDAGSHGRGYLLKERISDVDQLLGAIRSVAAGGSVIDPLVVETLVSDRAKASGAPLRRLTPREHETLEQMARGKNNAAIAASLMLSDRAVEKHINSVFSKLGLSQEPDVHRRVKAVLLFLNDRTGAPPQGG